MLSILAQADALIVLSPQRPAAKADDPASILPLE